MARYHINPKTGNPGNCTAVKSCPFGDLEQDHYASKDEARQAYETRQEQAAATTELTLVTPHEHADDNKTEKGNSYSKMTAQPDGTTAQTVNGELILIRKRDDSKRFPVEHNGKKLGYLTKGKTWGVEYADGSSGRSQKRSTDAIAAMLKKANPAPKPAGEAAPARGYNPKNSELDVYQDFPTNKTMTLGRLRKLNNDDLVRMYNRLELSGHNAHYTADQLSDEAAKSRVGKVLGERGERVEIGKHGELKPGYDYGTAPSYRLAPKDPEASSDDPRLAEKLRILKSTMDA